MAFPFSFHLIIHARLAKPCCHKKRRGGGDPGSLFQQLMPLWLLIGCLSWQPAGHRNKSHWPQCTCQEQERKTRAFREFEGELWDGWRKRALGKKMFLSSLRASGEEEVLCGTSKTPQTNKEVDLGYFLLKEPWSYTRLRYHSAPSISRSEGSWLQRARSELCGSVFKDLPTRSLFFPHG